MKPEPTSRSIRIAAIVAVISMVGCMSRYRLDLAVIESGEKHHVQVEQTQFARRTVLGDPASESQILPGGANCLIVTVGARKRSSTTQGKYEVLSYDEHLQYRLYLQLPAKLAVGTLPLTDHAFAQIMGRYELSKEEKLFAQSSGNVKIDSLSHNRAYLSIDGEFRNLPGQTVAIKGEFKVKIK